MTTIAFAASPHSGVELLNELPAPQTQGKPLTPQNRLMTVDTFSLTVDDLVVARARRGEPRAVEELYRLFECPVYNLARRLCRSSHEAEDILQETFVEMIRSLRTFRSEGSFAGWVRRIAVSKALQRLRRAHPVETLDDEAAHDIEDSHALRLAEVAAHRVDLETALTALSDTARSVLWLHDVEGYSHDEIGAMWGKTGSFSKSQLARAHARLRATLDPSGEEEECTLA